MIDYLLNSRAILDSKLIFDSVGIFEIAALVFVGMAAGLMVARQLWFASMEAALAENERLINEAFSQKVVKDKEEEQVTIPESELIPAVAGGFTNKSVAPAEPRQKFVVEPEYRTSDVSNIFTSSDVPADGAAAGSEDKPQRIVYIMDVSNSMTDPQLDLCKSELTKALEGLPSSAEYQVIFFSGATWFAHQKMISGGQQGERVVIQDGNKTMEWISRFGGFHYQEGNHNLPVGSWCRASTRNINKTLNDIKAVKQSFGTSWHLPFMLAMNLGPAPTEIYFLTDGETAHQDLVAEGIVEMVKNKSAETKIHTRSLMRPTATEPLRHIANQTAGEYLLIDLV